MGERPSLDDLITEAVACDFCGRPKGLRCRAPRTGRLYPYPHAVRYRAAQRLGVVEKFRAALAQVNSDGG